MAGTEAMRRKDWSSENCCHCEEEEKWFLEVFHLDCLPLATRRAECETCSSQGEGKCRIIRVLVIGYC